MHSGIYKMPCFCCCWLTDAQPLLFIDYLCLFVCYDSKVVPRFAFYDHYFIFSNKAL